MALLDLVRPRADVVPDWKHAHSVLSRLARERAAADAEEGMALLAALRSAAHVHLGHGSFTEYVERLLGYRPRTTREKLRVAEALESLPRLAGALGDGALSWCAVRELTRVATGDSEQAWLEVARGKTARQLEQLVAGKSPGDVPATVRPERPQSHVLRFEVAPETFASFREATQRLQRLAGEALDDDALLLTMARHVLEGPGQPGRSSYQVSLTVCTVCGGAQQLAGGKLVPIGADIVAMAACDAQNLGALLPRAANENARGAHEHRARASSGGHPPHEDASNRERASRIAPQTTPSDGAPRGEACGTSDTRGLSLDARVGATPQNDARTEGASERDGSGAPTGTGTGGTSDAGGISERARACAMDRNEARANASSREPCGSKSAHVGAADGNGGGVIPMKATPIARARQSIPPATRRAVLARDERRCRVPGCCQSVFVDVHHIQSRADGGTDHPGNLVTLCGAHHRATHRGELSVEVDRLGELVFRHADGTRYGHPVMPDSVDARAKVFSALRHLGFRERDARAVLADLDQDPTLRAAPIQRLLREALSRIRRHPAS